MKAARARRKEPELNPDTSPVKTVLGSLNTNSTTVNQTVPNRASVEPTSLDNKQPRTIEEVPFR